MKVSVILPTYNEAGNIIELIRKIMASIPREWEYEVIVVDDNSPDKTLQIVKNEFGNNKAVIPALRKDDRSLARSIRSGIELAQGEQIIVMDSDFTHDPAEIPKLLYVGKIYDIVSCSRFCSGGNMQNTQHYIASMLYNWLMRLVLKTQVQDNLGGYFTIKKEKIMQLPLGRIFSGYGEYFFCFLHFAQTKKMSIVEIPAFYGVRHSGKSKSNFFKLLFTYTRAVYKLRREYGAE
ncbi:MAG: glycosyltransferase [Candidatus Omnitrophica bacterium]|nr:glycosyltransferase [Candidatus Omnitrophota bacterium]